MLSSAHKDFTRSVHLFSDLNTDQLEHVTEHARVNHLGKDETLFSQGEAVQSFYMVYSGLVKLFRLSADGQEKVIEIVSPGQTFAEALMFLEHPNFPVSASALNDAEVIVFDASQFLKMLKMSSETCLVLLGTMSQRIRGLVQEIDNLSVQSGRHRLSSYLLQQAGDNNYLKLPVAKSVLASRLSIQPETFSRIVKQLKNARAIKIDGSDIEITDRDQLEDYAMI